MLFEVANAGNLNAIAAALENNTTLNVTLEGNVENNPINFDVAITMDVDVEIQPL